MAAYTSLLELLQREPIAFETYDTIDLMGYLSHIRFDNTLSKDELIAVCYWKSPRAIRLVRENDPDVVLSVSKAAFAYNDDAERMRQLSVLRGVSIPMASSILTLIWPEKYGVVDVRVWQLLFAFGTVSTKPSGIGLVVADWITFLDTLRTLASKTSRSVRSVEKTLFEYHKTIQVGTLYSLK